MVLLLVPVNDWYVWSRRHQWIFLWLRCSFPCSLIKIAWFFTFENQRRCPYCYFIVLLLLIPWEYMLSSDAVSISVWPSIPLPSLLLLLYLFFCLQFFSHFSFVLFLFLNLYFCLSSIYFGGGLTSGYCFFLQSTSFSVDSIAAIFERYLFTVTLVAFLI